MDHAIIAAKKAYIKYHGSLIHNVNDQGRSFCIRSLPLIDAPNTADCDLIRKIYNSDPPQVNELLDSVRRPDALGDSCVLQLAISPGQDGKYTCQRLLCTEGN